MTERYVSYWQRLDDLESRLSLDLAGQLGDIEARLSSRLDALSSNVRPVPKQTFVLKSVLDQALETAMSLLRADRGNVQIADPATGALRIAAQAGFSAEFLEYFAVVDDEASACGRAATNLAQIVIPDVTTEPGFAAHRDIAAASGFRAVQSTPLIDSAGVLRGVLSTHYREPYQPPAHDLEVMRRLGLLVGHVIG